MGRILKIILRTILVVVSIVCLYGISAYILMNISVNSDFTECDKNAVEIFVRSNGVHTDLILPLKHELKDWSTLVNPLDTKEGDKDIKYVAFGWGDKGFYLETPTWAELKFTTAFKAMFFLSSTAMHVAFHKNINESESCVKLCISHDSYQKLIQYVENSFEKEANSTILIKGASYWNNDLFYEAKGTYSLFNTCNTWANGGLKAANLKACLWTPLDKGILKLYTEPKN